MSLPAHSFIENLWFKKSNPYDTSCTNPWTVVVCIYNQVSNNIFTISTYPFSKHIYHKLSSGASFLASEPVMIKKIRPYCRVGVTTNPAFATPSVRIGKVVIRHEGFPQPHFFSFYGRSFGTENCIRRTRVSNEAYKERRKYHEQQSVGN